MDFQNNIYQKPEFSKETENDASNIYENPDCTIANAQVSENVVNLRSFKHITTGCIIAAIVVLFLLLAASIAILSYFIVTLKADLTSVAEEMAQLTLTDPSPTIVFSNGSTGVENVPGSQGPPGPPGPPGLNGTQGSPESKALRAHQESKGALDLQVNQDYEDYLAKLVHQDFLVIMEHRAGQEFEEVLASQGQLDYRDYLDKLVHLAQQDNQAFGDQQVVQDEMGLLVLQDLMDFQVHSVIVLI